MMYTLMAPVQFVLSPALRATLTTFNDSFRPLNGLEMLSLVPMVLLTALLLARSKEPAVGLPPSSGLQQGMPKKGGPSLPLSYSPASLPVAQQSPRRPPGSANASKASDSSDRRRRGSHDGAAAIELLTTASTPLVTSRETRPQQWQQ